MANTRNSGTNHEYAKVDTNPGSTGYFTNPICPRDKRKVGADKIYFSIRETNADISANPSALSTITVTLQFKCPGDLAWTDFVDFAGNSLAIGNRIELDDSGAGILWRAGVEDDNFSAGSVTFGFDW